MTLIDVDLEQEPLDIKNFLKISLSDYPYCLIGFQLKSLYDQKRISLKLKYKAQDYIHILPEAKLTPSFFRGIRLSLKPSFLPLVERLRQLNTSLTNSVKELTYKNILSEYNLSCDDCYAFLRKGVYPVDGKHLQLIADTDLTLDELYEDAFNTKQVPVFQSYSSFTIFLLCNETVFKR